MKKFTIVLSLIVALSCIPGYSQQSFKEKQMSFERVADAYEICYSPLKIQLGNMGVDISKLEIFLAGYKLDRTLEVWVREKGQDTLSLFKQYDICALSGKPGPKRKQGDLQVPEGFYNITIFNPWSNFHLSLGTDYPNRADRILGDPQHPGGDIYIHGSCVTIGCLPITDKYIRELYVLCVEARNNGQKNIPVHLYPDRFTEDRLQELVSTYHPDKSTINLWNQLQQAYNILNREKVIPGYTINADGSYTVKQ